MAKNKKVKKVHKQKMNPLVRMALEKELKKRIDSPEEREKVMMALSSLDLKTLVTDPDALAAVMSDPAGQLRNYVNDGIDPDADLQGSNPRDVMENTSEICGVGEDNAEDVAALGAAAL